MIIIMGIMIMMATRGDLSRTTYSVSTKYVCNDKRSRTNTWNFFSHFTAGMVAYQLYYLHDIQTLELHPFISVAPSHPFFDQSRTGEAPILLYSETRNAIVHTLMSGRTREWLPSVTSSPNIAAPNTYEG